MAVPILLLGAAARTIRTAGALSAPAAAAIAIAIAAANALFFLVVFHIFNSCFLLIKLLWRFLEKTSANRPFTVLIDSGLIGLKNFQPGQLIGRGFLRIIFDFKNIGQKKLY
jgi:hypothetical protein